MIETKHSRFFKNVLDASVPYKDVSSHTIFLAHSVVSQPEVKPLFQVQYYYSSKLARL